ncbi:hypothetical protein [Amycolatopsis pittospori]|uniref:hypothetical protein n=1 Tax=Amycolatopsis pittospori TaxID=2749434 RepID=UPI0015F121DF|nr:hypothetical protein [Amycolatopsis pittospori]
MITLKLLGLWLKITCLTVLAVILEGVLVRGFWWTFLTVGVTVLVYIGLTAGIWKEWRAERNGAGTYQIIHYTRD